MSNISTSCFVILPIHLFNEEIIKDTLDTILKSTKELPAEIFIIEEPAYFGDHKMQLNYNKLKLIYHRASMKYYNDYITNYITKYITNSTHTNNKIKITYLDYKSLTVSISISKGYNPIKQYKQIHLFNPVDTYLESKYKKLFKNKLIYNQTPLFLCTDEDLESYHNSKPNKESYYHASFYKWQRTRLNILPDSKTYDTENRNMMPLDTKVPPLPKNDSSTSAKKYLDESISYVQNTWKHNLEPFKQDLENPARKYDDNQYRQQLNQQSNQQSNQQLPTQPTIITPESIHFPITHQTALLWLQNFCKIRFSQFGKYEDSIDAGNPNPRNFLFHSCISPMLNIGLLTPAQVIETVSKYYKTKSNTAKIGIENYEGFIRQVIGWREYQRYIYKYAGEKMRSSNHFGNDRRLTEHWYNGTTQIKPVDDAIKMAINDGYIHHILRLMVIGNIMNLVGIHPDDVYKWFMEFSLDSYDWVMIGNVYSMALWADGGLTMRKPYISGDGYIMKMSNYKKVSGNSSNAISWNVKWNSLLHHFIDRNNVKLSKTYYNGLVKAWNRKSESEREKELKIANEIIKNITK